MIRMQRIDTGSSTSYEKRKQKTKYPAYYFVIGTMLLYYFIIRPNSSVYAGLFGYLLLAIGAAYLFFRWNEDIETRALRYKKRQERVAQQEKERAELGLPIDASKINLNRRNKSKSFGLHTNKPSTPKNRRDIHVDYECEHCIYG